MNGIPVSSIALAFARFTASLRLHERTTRAQAASAASDGAFDLASRAASARICSAARSPITVTQALVLPPISVGMIDASATRSAAMRSEEHTSELQSLMRISYAVFCLKKKKKKHTIKKCQHTHR